MKISYDKETDTLRILFRDVEIEESDENESGVIVDYDADGDIVGLEILDASQQMDQSFAVDIATPAV